MLRISWKPQRSWLGPALAAGLFYAVSLVCLASIGAAAFAQNSRAGRVIGVIDDVRIEGDRNYVFGWACQQGNPGSIEVHIYADHSANETPHGTFVTAGKADMASEPAVGRECQDAKGGHRFKIALPNQLMRTFQRRKFYAHGIAVAGNVENAAIARSGALQFPKPAWPAEPPTPDVLDGARVAAFDTSRDSCEQTDIPDAAARAFRDYKGTVHLVASHSVTRAGLGPTLESAKHNCQVLFNSHHDANPADFDDYTWLDSFYAVDGKRIIALGHMEYHGWEHPGMCASKTDTATCWYNADTFYVSEDGGYHFASPRAPTNYVAGLPYKYQVNQGPEGYSIDSNIVKSGDWYYATVYAWQWPPHCGSGKGERPCLVPDAASVIRTADILDPSSWRCWDGKDFSIAFVDPYRGTVARPQDHVCTSVPYMDYANAINFHAASHLFVATMWDAGSGNFGPHGLYFTTSPDLIHWSKPALAITLNQFLQREPEGNWSYGYFSLIDPKSTDASYSTITDNPYLYYVRLDDNHGPYKRVLFRQRIKLGWLLKASGNPTAH